MHLPINNIYHQQSSKFRRKDSSRLSKYTDEMANTNKDWQTNADTHKMSAEEVRKAGVEPSKRPPGHNPGEVLHQRRRLPYSTTTMALGGFFVVAAIGYGVLYYQSKPGTSPVDVAKATMAPDSPTGGDMDKGPRTTVQS